MNTFPGKTIYSDKSVPHFAQDPAEATHRYRDIRDTEWKYMLARSDHEFLAWGAGWMENRKPQAKRGNVWRAL